MLLYVTGGGKHLAKHTNEHTLTHKRMVVQ